MADEVLTEDDHLRPKLEIEEAMKVVVEAADALQYIYDLLRSIDLYTSMIQVRYDCNKELQAEIDRLKYIIITGDKEGIQEVKMQDIIDKSNRRESRQQETVSYD